MGATDVVSHLLDRGLLAAADAVSPDLSVVAAPRRNNNFKVIRPDGTGLFVKQAMSSDRAVTLAREAAAYRVFAAAPGSAISWHPTLQHHDEEKGILVLDLLPGVRTLVEQFHRSGRASRTLARALGRTLAAVHTLPDMPNEVSGAQLPWVLRLARPDVATLRSASAGSLDLIRLVQSSAAFVDVLQRVRVGWSAEAPIHADLRWDNCLVQPGRSKTRVIVVDWEMIGRGDPAWDLGNALAGYLQQWLSSVPLVGGVPLEQSVTRARFPLESLHPAMAELLHAYLAGRAAAGAAIEEPDKFTLRTVNFVAATVLQTAFEESQAAAKLLPHLTYLVQLAFNILQRPSEAAVHLFGIDPAVPA